MKLTITVDVEPNDYCSVEEVINAVRKTLVDPRRVRLGQIRQGKRRVDLILNHDTVNVVEG